MITLENDPLSFTFPEIARQLRAHAGRKNGSILIGAQRRIEKMSS